MKTSLIRIFVLVAIMFGFISCNDFLKEEPNGQLMSNSAFTQASDLDGAVNVLYRQVSRSTFGITQFIQAIMGDDLSTHRASNKAGIREWDLYGVSTGNDRLLWCWQDKWLVIKAANFIINGASNTPNVTEEDLNYALNQAHFWRAWAYYYLVRTFGPLPMVTSNEVDFSIGLSTVSDIFNMIVTDLQAAENLPANYTDTPRSMNGINIVANSAAAKAMLSNVYLTMAGWPLNLGTEYYEKAAAKALEVITGVENGTYKYSLYENYADIHSVAENKKNKECILGIYYSNSWGDGDSSESARGCINDFPDCTGGWCDTRAEIGFWVNFPKGPRKDATYPVVTYNSGDGKAYPWWSESLPDANRYPYFGKSKFTNDGTEYDIYKSLGSQCNGWVDQTHQMIRLSEVYLWYAEALGRSGQTNAKAIELLNIVRNRADGNGVKSDASINHYSLSMTASELAEAAYNEHGWEIAGWLWGAIDCRYNDMQRMDRVQDHFNTRVQNPTYVIPGAGGITRQEPNTPTGSWSESLMYVPYPEQDVNRNAALNISLADKLNLIK